MVDIYSSPKSDVGAKTPIDNEKTKLHDEAEALRALYKSQRVIWTPINVLIVSVFLIVVMSFATGRVPVLAFIVPAFICGGMAKFIGKIFAIKHRLISSVVLGVVVLFAFQDSMLIAILLALFNMLIFLVLSRCTLSFDEEKLLYKESLGKLKR